MDIPIRVLLIEDSPEDAVLIRRALSEAKGGKFQLDWAETAARGFALLASGGFGAILLDLSLPDSLGLSTLSQFLNDAADLPVVVLTGLDDEIIAAKALERGAQDYLIKGRLDPDNLARALRYSIARKTLERQKEEYLHNVNHELRSPLAGIYIALTMIKDDLPAQAGDSRALLEMATQNVEHLTKMTDDLVEVLRSESGKLAIHPTRISLSDALRQSVSLMALARQAQGIALSVDVPSDLPFASADETRLKQILFNLIGNSIKFTAKGGSIVLRARAWDKSSEFLCVSVADTGCGIPPEALKRVFSRLYQVSVHAHNGHGGLGIGLYLCHQLVTGQGGTMWVESQVGKGSTFHFTLPVFP